MVARDSIAKAFASPSNMLNAAVALATVANLCRDADGVVAMPLILFVALHLPLIALAAVVMRSTPPSSNALCSRTVLVLALAGCVGLSILSHAPTAGLLALALFALGCRLFSYLSRLVDRIESNLSSPAQLNRRLVPTWLIATVIVASVLALPIATNPGVPDYKYDAFGHIAACVQTTVSVACLQGNTALSIQGDLQPLGQVLLFALMQFSGVVFASIALALVKPILVRPPTLRKVLTIAGALQVVGALILMPAWHSEDAGTALERVWWSAAHAASAFWNGGITLSPTGLAKYLDAPGVFLVITALAVCGSLGVPIMHALFQRAPSETDTRHQLCGGNFATLEAMLAFQVLAITTIALVWFENPTSPFFDNRPALPFEVSDRMTALHEMNGGERWQASVYTAATARSAGMASVPVSQGTLSWASVGVLVGNMLFGGGLAGTGGGLRVTSFLLLVTGIFYRRTQLGPMRLPSFGSLMIALGILAAFNALTVAIMLMLVDATDYAIVLDTLAAANSNGYATGLAPHLSPVAKFVLVGVLIVGRWLPYVIWAWLLRAFFIARRD